MLDTKYSILTLESKRGLLINSIPNAVFEDILDYTIYTHHILTLIIL